MASLRKHDLGFWCIFALAYVCWLTGARLSLVKISASADHYYRTCDHMMTLYQGQVRIPSVMTFVMYA